MACVSSLLMDTQLCLCKFFLSTNFVNQYLKERYSIQVWKKYLKKNHEDIIRTSQN